MKFSKDLDEQAVPEWKTKYLDYKGGKKKVKAVAKAVRELDSKLPGQSRGANTTSPFSSLRDAPVKSLLRRSPAVTNGRSASTTNAPLSKSRSRSEALSPQWAGAEAEGNVGDAPGGVHFDEHSPLRTPEPRATPRWTRYGSIIGSPPQLADSDDGLRPASTLELPMPSIDPDYDRPISPTETAPSVQHGTQDTPKPPRIDVDSSQTAQEPPKDSLRDAKSRSRTGSRYAGLLSRSLQRSASTPGTQPLVTRVFSFASRDAPVQAQNQSQEIPLEDYESREVDLRRTDFLLFLDGELSKIGVFYKEKEDEATERLKLLRSQLHIMRYWRLQDIQNQPTDYHNTNHRHLSTIANVGQDKIGKTSQSMAQLGSPTLPADNAQIERSSVAGQDYQRTPIKYQSAKRKLKHAFQELYRALELLKSYSTVNQTAFRKIIKKYNKTVASLGQPTTNYMNEKVNTAEFVTSNRVDELMQDIEDLYARYFERGNRKTAVGKLRAKIHKASDYGGPMFRTGALLFTGLVLGIQGIVYAATRYYAAPVASESQVTTSYLLQIYGGYFCFLALAFLFVLDAMVFEKFHVNYPFIFELDNRSTINWRQLSELPSAFACILGVCMWLNFNPATAGDTMYIYWPIVLIGVSVLLLFAPIPRFFYFGSRRWLSYSLYRLAFVSGLVNVEFRDFFLGDMFCSQTYAMGNLELYFCLYANTSNDHWINPGQCNSTSSRLLGFFSTLPGIWRALQCMRRYRDTLNWYPHLANLGKYTCTILQYMFLSLWRLQEHSDSLKAAFITMASINSIYCIYWDIVNDWSLSPTALRPTLAYRKHRWWYYAAMIEDMVFRFVWVGYVIFPRDYQVQHSSLISFMIAMLEIIRRGIWVIFRVENEHCTNVARYRAVKHPELPYPERPESQVDGAAGTAPDQDSPVARALKRVGSTVLTAHAQDYERRRPTTVEEEGGSDDEDDDGSDDDG